MVNFDAKSRLLRKRAAALALPEGAMELAAEVVSAAGLRLPNIAETLRVEWFNDILASPDPAHHGLAARDPSGNFLAWLRERVRRRFHVTYRSIEAVARAFGPEAASRLVVVWEQEIAWAQRMRTFRNPLVATKAALFLREAEGTPGKVFERIAETFADHFASADYVSHPAHDMAAREIRFGQNAPDFTPLFLRYAARAYAERLMGMGRDKLEALAARAAREEEEDRERAASQRSAEIARQAPLRRIVAVFAAAEAEGVSPNDLFRMEQAFVDLLSRGQILLQSGTGSPHARFVEELRSPERRGALLASAPPPAPGEDPDSLAWSVVNMKPSWVDQLPDSFRLLSDALRADMAGWQTEIAEERREPPLDPVSDFGFHLIGSPR